MAQGSGLSAHGSQLRDQGSTAGLRDQGSGIRVWYGMVRRLPFQQKTIFMVEDYLFDGRQPFWRKMTFLMEDDLSDRRQPVRWKTTCPMEEEF
jgi:hypothetical protein